MVQTWKVRMYQEGDETGIVNLMNLVFPRSEYNMRRWSWEYKDNPYGFLAVVGEHNGKIVGHMGAPFVDVKVGNETIRSSQACDLCVHPDFRRQGMFVAIEKAFVKGHSDEGVSFSFGFPNKHANYLLLRQGQWFDVARIPVLATYFDTYEAITEKYKRLERIDHATKRFSRFLDYLFARRRKKGEHEFSSMENLMITKASCFDKRMNEFWNRVSKNYGTIVVRNRKYLNWRYYDRPDVDYNVFLAEKNGQIEGYLVLSTKKKEKRKVGYVVDVLSSSRDVIIDFVHTSIEYLTRQSVDSIECMMLKKHVGYKALKENGFTPYFKRKRRFLGRIYSRQFFQSYKKVKEWYVTYGDSDHV